MNAGNSNHTNTTERTGAHELDEFNLKLSEAFTHLENSRMCLIRTPSGLLNNNVVVA